MDGFIVLGTINAITYKEIFPLIKDGKVRLGYNHIKMFCTERGLRKFGNIGWYSSLPVVKPTLTLTATYKLDKYPKYDNYDAINIDRIKDIPYDYDGVMGVPISFLDKYCPSQFEILGITARWSDMKTKEYSKSEYKNANDLNGSWVIFKDGIPKMGYKRLLIRKVKETAENHGKKFIIIGNMNAITYKEIFPYIKNNQLWIGYRSLGSEFYFNITDDYKTRIVKEKKEGSGWKEINGIICGRVANACWFTNIEHNKRKEGIYIDGNHYSPEKYPKYDNYDAIEVSRVENIPCDYNGIMGVPISFMDKYCPSQFEILGMANNVRYIGDYPCLTIINGKPTYNRILIRKKISENKIKTVENHGKKFIIIGNMGALTDKDIFPYVKENKLWWGVSIHSGDRKFYVPNNYPLNASTCGVDENGKRFVNVKGIRWWTNVNATTAKEPLDLVKTYNEKDYPKYDNYDAIEVGKTADIPCDYNDVMGVPITFFDKYCPSQFEIIWKGGDIDWAENECDFYTPPTAEDAKRYKAQNKTWRIQNPYLLNGNLAETVYSRIFIRKKPQTPSTDEE